MFGTYDIRVRGQVLERKTAIGRGHCRCDLPTVAVSGRNFDNDITDSNGTAGNFAEISAAATLAGMAAFIFVMRAGEKS
ncbi:MAG: hypothetical protein ACI93T_004112, partial [Porticoccaceae bacterium]